MDDGPLLFGLKACDTCRKALKSVPQLTLVDVREIRMSEDILDRALDAFGEKLVNNRSTTWRALSEDERKIPAKELLVAHPVLMKRPLILVDNQLFLGWNNEIEMKVRALLQEPL